MTKLPERRFGNLLYSAWDLSLIRWDQFFSTRRSRFSLRLQHCPYGRRLITNGICSFKAKSAGSISLGHNVIFNAGWRSNRVGLSNPVILQTLGNGRIEIGDNSGGSAIIISAKTSVKIGRHVKMGGNVRILDHDYHSLDAIQRREPDNQDFSKSAAIVIEDDVFIGTNSIILRGAQIGAGAIIGAGAVVAGIIPPGQTWVGNPARPSKNTRPS